ncbi:MAG TPA: dihydropteroate synthase [Terriglobales bacterium]|nr:dihydropteroate synthase [Terriglobales bacterium]
MRAIFQWKMGSRVLELGRRTLIMGIVNVTPDSFSDGGLYIDAEKAVVRAEQLLDEGATIIDVGGESTRPGASVASRIVAAAVAIAIKDGPAPEEVAQTAPMVTEPVSEEPVSEEEERRRVLPVIRDLKRRRPDAVVSVDTYKASVARAAVELGAEVVNDVSGFRWDPKMAKTLAELKVGAVLMHTRGRPQEWRSLPPIGDPVLMVKRDLRQWAETATLAGIKRDRLVLDPGFGFGKRFEENYPLLAHFAELQQMGFPLLAGVSRKSFIGRMLARDGKDKDAGVAERLYGTLAAEAVLILKGVHIIRTHDVRFAVEAARVADAIVASGG